MQVSETFSKLVSAALLLVVGVAIVVFFSLLVPGTHVQAQNAGNTGTFTVSQIAFSNQTSTGPSVVFKNIGQSAHFLTFCLASGTGNAQVNLEQSFDGVKLWAPMATGITVGASACNTIQAGGYFQNVRANILHRSPSGNPGISAFFIS